MWFNGKEAFCYVCVHTTTVLFHTTMLLQLNYHVIRSKKNGITCQQLTCQRLKFQFQIVFAERSAFFFLFFFKEKFSLHFCFSTSHFGQECFLISFWPNGFQNDFAVHANLWNESSMKSPCKSIWIATKSSFLQQQQNPFAFKFMD